MKNSVNPHRRRLLLGALLLPAAPIVGAAIVTPAASEGPFYPTDGMRFGDIDNDLVKITGRVREAGGEVVRISGRVLDTQDRPVENALVEIWQCDVNGRYLHKADFGWSSRDNGFQGFGRSLSGADGHFEFRTIKPVPYSGRTPHIHVKIWYQGRERLTTQWYLPDHPDNQRDALYLHIPQDQRKLVTLYFDHAAEPRAKVELVI